MKWIPQRRTRFRLRRPPLKRTARTGPIAVAITGGIGAGKTEALRAFARHGAATSSSDETVHRLLREDPEVQAALRERWGEEVVRADGADRAAIAEIAFADHDELMWLESLLHPKVVREYGAWLEQQTAPVVVTEVPLLYETGAEERFDVVVAITAPTEIREERIDVPIERERRLIPDEEKIRRANYAYVNDGTLEELDAFVADVMAQLTQQ